MSSKKKTSESSINKSSLDTQVYIILLFLFKNEFLFLYCLNI